MSFQDMDSFAKIAFFMQYKDLLDAKSEVF